MYKFCIDFKEAVVVVKQNGKCFNKTMTMQWLTIQIFYWFKRISCIFNTVNLKPCNGQRVTFKWEHKNPYKNFPVAGKTLLKAQIELIIVGHVPR